jgi:predicted anti-sigma-YlaC factor YlaD
MTHPTYEDLNDFVDEQLSADAMATLRAHLAECAECTAMVAQLRELRSAARALPRSVTAPPEVWDVVRAATIDNAKAQRKRVLWQLRYQLAAAAVVLLGVASSLTWWVASTRQPVTVVRTVPAPTAPHTNLVAYRAVEADYRKAAGALMTLLEQRRSTMDTAVVRSVEENLRTMDDAIRKARAALLSDPGNQDVASILAATHESKLRMLRRAVGGT